MRILLILVFFICSIMPVHAIAHPFKKIGPFKIPKFTRTLAQQQMLNKAQRHLLHQQYIPAFKLKQSMSTIKLPTENLSVAHWWENPQATIFVIQETYNGQKRLWGVTATHYFFKNPSLKSPSSKEEEPITFVAQGHWGLNDISLFPIPTHMQHQFVPLKLAPHSAQPGDKLYSAGYFDDEFHIEKNRIVVDKMPHKLITSLKVEDKLCREGACGGPVLNKQGEVVGVHVGSSQRRQLGFMVPVEHIHDLLHAYHNNANAQKPFYFNGRQLGAINVNEFIKSIEVRRGPKLLDTFLFYRSQKPIDYEHLENLVDASQADQIIIHVERMPFSALDEDQHLHEYEITYNLKNFHVSKRTIR